MKAECRGLRSRGHGWALGSQEPLNHPKSETNTKLSQKFCGGARTGDRSSRGGGVLIGDRDTTRSG
jgi:hypothetical protein